MIEETAVTGPTMRWTRPLLLTASMLAACGDSVPAGDPDGGSNRGDAGDGVPIGNVDPAFPALASGCRSRAIFADYDLCEARGVRRMTPAEPPRWDLGLNYNPDSDDYLLALFLPSLNPGLYTPLEGAGASQYFINTYGSEYNEGGAMVEIVGRNEEAIWGRFVARLCGILREEGCREVMIGRFASLIESVPSRSEFSQPPVGGRATCETEADCRSPEGCAAEQCLGNDCVVDDSRDVPEACRHLDPLQRSGGCDQRAVDSTCLELHWSSAGFSEGFQMVQAEFESSCAPGSQVAACSAVGRVGRCRLTPADATFEASFYDSGPGAFTEAAARTQCSSMGGAFLR